MPTKVTFTDRKKELIEKLSDACISVAVAQQQLAREQEILDKLKAEYDGILRFEEREEAAVKAVDEG